MGKWCFSSSELWEIYLFFFFLQSLPKPINTELFFYFQSTVFIQMSFLFIGWKFHVLMFCKLERYNLFPVWHGCVCLWVSESLWAGVLLLLLRAQCSSSGSLLSLQTSKVSSGDLVGISWLSVFCVEFYCLYQYVVSNLLVIYPPWFLLHLWI